MLNFFRVDVFIADVNLNPNPEEVMDTRYVSYQELCELMEEDNDLLWSPWFRIIVSRWMGDWWGDLEETLSTDKHVDDSTIHRFDPPNEHMGGGGEAGRWLDDLPKSDSGEEEERKFDASQKQGGYGKIQIHKESTLCQISHLDEILGAVYFKLRGSNLLQTTIDITNDDVKFCDDILGSVSRSFAAVIRQLPEGLCLDVLVFYLVLRGLDTIEDDMTAFETKDEKIQLLHNFHIDALDASKTYSMDGVGEGDEKLLLQNFFKVTSVFASLRETSQQVIQDIAKKMGDGMAEFIQKDLGEGTTTIEEYYRYCYFVAGLVGEGLSRLFLVNDYEPNGIEEPLMENCYPMGQFLQRTNIIRDYLEDYVDKRAFWPKEVWNQYAEELGDLAKEENIENALHCVNHLVFDALKLIPNCLDYLELLSDPKIFRFCAIPQMMAIATLDKVFNNPKTFSGVVKIRKGLSVRLILDSTSYSRVCHWFDHFMKSIRDQCPPSDPHYDDINALCEQVCERTQKVLDSPKDKEGINDGRIGKVLDLMSSPFSWISFAGAPLLMTTSFLTLLGSSSSRGGLGVSGVLGGGNVNMMLLGSFALGTTTSLISLSRILYTYMTNSPPSSSSSSSSSK